MNKRNIMMLAFLGIASITQAQQFVLYKNDGTKVKLNVAEIDSIAFHNDSWKDPDGTPNRVKMSLTATIGSDETNAKGIHKVAFGGTGTTKAMNWSDKDTIGVYQSGTVNTFILKSGAGTKIGTFEGLASTSGTTALSPRQPYATYKSDTQIGAVILPVTQPATAGSFHPKAGLMMGLCSDVNSTTNNTINFKNICSYIAVTPPCNCREIIVSTLTSDEYLAGKINVDYNNGAPSYTVTDGSTHVTLYGDMQANSTYYIAVLPGSYTGLRVTCFDGSKYSSRKANKEINLPRSQYTDLSAALATPAKDSYVDLGITLNGKTLYWATTNIGATSPQDYGNYYGWGEIAPANSYSTNWNKYKRYYDWSTYGLASNSNPNKYYQSDSYRELESTDDVATTYLGTGWRMPTQAEFQALIDNCVWEYTDNYNSSGVKGFIVYKKKEKSGDTEPSYSLSDTHIFLPYTGRKGFINGTGSATPNETAGYYWSSTVNTSDYTTAYDLEISTNTSASPNTYSRTVGSNFRPYGCTIRPVYVGN